MNANQNQRYSCLMACNQNQNQRYECRVAFPGYSCLINGMNALMAFPGHEPGIKPIKALPGYEVRMEINGMNA